MRGINVQLPPHSAQPENNGVTTLPSGFIVVAKAPFSLNLLHITRLIGMVNAYDGQMKRPSDDAETIE